MIKNEERSFIYNLDILSGKPSLFISGHKNYSTIFGLITTLLILIIGIIYGVYSLFIFFFAREMSVVELSDNFMTTNLKIPIKDFLFAFNVFKLSMKIQYYWGKEINLLSGQNVTKEPLNYKYTVKLYYENPETKTVIKESYLETEYCEADKNINQNIIDKYNFTDYKKYLCISDKSNFEITINQNYNTYVDIIVSLDLNSTDGINKNKIEENKTYITVDASYLQFEMYSPNDIISNKNSSTPINFRKNYFTYELVSPGTLKKTEIITKYIDYSSDNGYIIQKLKKFNGFMIESTQTKEQKLGLDIIKTIIYNEFRLYFNGDDIASYKRIYIKLPEIIASISSVISLFITVGQILVGFLCKYYIETETMSQVFQSLLFEDSKIKLEKRNINKVKYVTDSNSSQKKLKNLTNNSNQKNKIINNRGKDSIKNINIINNEKNESNYIDDNLSKNIMVIKNNSSKEQNILQNDYNEKIDISLNNNEDNKINKKNINKINPIFYTKTFFKILRVNPNESQNKKINLHSFSYCDYFRFILNKKKNNRMKFIDKLSIFLEKTLSIEEIIQKEIYIEIAISFIELKFGKEFNSFNYMKIWLKKDNELKKLLEDEKKKIYNNKSV